MKQHTYKIGIQFSDVLQRKKVFKSWITKLIWGRQQIYLLCNITVYGILNLNCLIYSFSKIQKNKKAEESSYETESVSTKEDGAPRPVEGQLSAIKSQG